VRLIALSSLWCCSTRGQISFLELWQLVKPLTFLLSPVMANIGRQFRSGHENHAANGRYSLCRAEHSAVGCTFTDHVVVDLHACNGALNSDYTLLLVARSLLLPGD